MFAKIISVTSISGVTVENILPESVELLESLGEEFPMMSLFTLNLTSKHLAQLLFVKRLLTSISNPIFQKFGSPKKTKKY
jgi:hypothetical protein